MFVLVIVIGLVFLLTVVNICIGMCLYLFFSMQVLDLHRSSNKLLSLIPCLASNEDVNLVGYDRMSELADVPVSSRVRVLTGTVFLLF